MKFRSEQAILAEALGALARIASGHGAGTPAMAGVKMNLTGDVLVLSATNGDISLQFVIAAGGERDGQALVSARMLNDIVRAMPSGRVTIEVSADNCSVSAGRAQFTLPTLAAMDYPRSTPATGEALSISTESFRNALGQVVFAVSTDLQKPHITSVQMSSTENGLRLVATDGYRLAMRDVPNTAGIKINEFLIPGKALSELERLLDSSADMSIRFSDQEAVFLTASMTLSTRLVNANFPPYSGLVLDKNTNTAVVRKDELLDALRRTNILASETAPVRVKMSEEGMRLTVQLTDGTTCVEDLDSRYDGEEMTIAFSSQYLRDGVAACEAEEVSLRTSASNKPASVRPVGDSSYLYVIMPQRL
jgi:DNA polymerase-3 subunit beta